MRIRKRFQNHFPSSDLSSPLPPSGPAVAAAVAAALPPVAAERGAAAAVVEGAEMAATALLSGGGRCGGGRGKGGFHPDGAAAIPTPCLPPFPPPSGASAAGRDGEGVPPNPGLRLAPEMDSPPDHGHDNEVAAPKMVARDGNEVGDAPSRNGAKSIASRSIGAEASEASSGPGHMPPLTADQAVPRWGKKEGEFPALVKRIASHDAARGIIGSLGVNGGGEEDVVSERDVKPMVSTTRRRRAAAFGTRSTTALATERCDGTLAKVEGDTDVTAAAAAASAEEGNVGVGKGKKRRSPAVLMEGSRCSRVNGRGWRCCQQTLVGYSLCEHHLGKGRLRSVSSVRGNGRTAAPEEDAGGRHESHDPAGTKRIGRRNNVGTVKARSLSSLLHQPEHQQQQHASPTVAIAAPPPVPCPSPSPTPAARPATAAAPPPRATDTVVA